MRIVSLVVATSATALAQEPPANATEPPPYEEFLVIPLRVHVLRSPEFDEVNCALGDADIERIVGKVNAIWHKAGIHFGLESVAREPAMGAEQFRLARALETPPPLSAFRVLLPPVSRKFDGLHVYYIHKFRVNGVYMGSDYAVVQETARLREVEGGIDEPIPRVTAHELGHALGLPHRQDRTNLLASGTTGTLLNIAEVDRSRRGARRIAGCASVSRVRAAAEAAQRQGDLEKARRLWGWLAAIPGAPAEAAKPRLGAIRTP